MLSPLLTGVSFLLQLSRVKALKALGEGLSIYCVFIAEPAIGKSPAMNVVRKALLAVENF